MATGRVKQILLAPLAQFTVTGLQKGYYIFSIPGFFQSICHYFRNAQTNTTPTFLHYIGLLNLNYKFPLMVLKNDINFGAFPVDPC